MAATSRSEPAVDKGHFLCQCLLPLRTGRINLKHHYQVSIPWSIQSIRSSSRLIRRPRCRVAACELMVCDVRLSDPRIRGPAAGGSSNLRLPPRPPCAAHRALGFEHAARFRPTWWCWARVQAARRTMIPCGRAGSQARQTVADAAAQGTRGCVRTWERA